MLLFLDNIFNPAGVDKHDEKVEFIFKTYSTTRYQVAHSNSNHGSLFAQNDSMIKSCLCFRPAEINARKISISYLRQLKVLYRKINVPQKDFLVQKTKQIVQNRYY